MYSKFKGDALWKAGGSAGRIKWSGEAADCGIRAVWERVLRCGGAAYAGYKSLPKEFLYSFRISE